MALTVNFWSYSKRDNSTAIPAGAPDRSLSCSLKSDSGILSPILEIGLGMTFNPSSLNYAQIPSYNRYYRVTDWQWAAGLWIASLQVDVLASFRTEIGATSKYIIRAASDYNPDIVDTFYPPEQHITASWEYYGFPWSDNDFVNGTFVLGVITGHGLNLLGTTSYYLLDIDGIRQFTRYMFPDSDQWTNLTTLNEYVYKSIYDPLQFVVSCKYFPFPITGTAVTSMGFGNFYTDVGAGEAITAADRLGQPSTWPVFTHDYVIASDWLTRDAKYRAEPYCNIYYYLNPFGVVSLSPDDFSLSDTVRVRVTPDIVSGEATLQIYSLVGSSEILVQQRVAMIGQDVNLSADSRSMSAAVASLVGGVVRGSTEMAAGQIPISGITQAGNAAISMLQPIAETASRGSPSIKTVDGFSRLYVRRSSFADEKNAEFGRPLYEDRIINTMTGFIKCGDGDIAVPGYPEEISRIGEYLTGGFFYE